MRQNKIKHNNLEHDSYPDSGACLSFHLLLTLSIPPTPLASPAAGGSTVTPDTLAAIDILERGGGGRGEGRREGRMRNGGRRDGREEGEGREGGVVGREDEWRVGWDG